MNAAEFDALFLAQYPRVRRLVARVVRDPGRAEELASDTLMKLWREPAGRAGNVEAWLRRVAVRSAIDELRRRDRRDRFSRWLGLGSAPPDPGALHDGARTREQVRAVLARMEPRQSELLLLRSEGLSYKEIAEAAGIHPASVGTLLARAQQTFRKEYVARYGER